MIGTSTRLKISSSVRDIERLLRESPPFSRAGRMSSSHPDAVLAKPPLELGDGDFTVVKHAAGERRVDARAAEHLREVQHRSGAAGGHQGDPAEAANGPQ